MTWIEQYRCGCTVEANMKRDLPGYCGTHGDNVTVTYQLDPKKPFIVTRRKKVNA